MIEIKDVWYTDIFIKQLDEATIRDKYITKNSKVILDVVPLLYNDFIKCFYDKEYRESQFVTQSLFVTRTENVKVDFSNSPDYSTTTMYTLKATMNGTIIPFEHYSLFQRCPWNNGLWYYYELKKD